jgi:phosphoribosylformylglycinamidine (FGAM) synthase-like amidotransferase family enzyme
LDEQVRCPVAHGEGRYVASSAVLDQLRSEDRIAFRYAENDYPANPNGSTEAIAGVCDSTGLVLGMMPHPENHVTERQGHAMVSAQKQGRALPLFRNGVVAARAS